MGRESPTIRERDARLWLPSIQVSMLIAVFYIFR